ncbi:MAG: DNA-binding protein WhiA [Clostridiales bacterium]|nr:DNA-binding protein WhiA [Clostridiales bacterium]
MSFSSETKEELIKLRLKGKKQKNALFCGFTGAIGTIALNRRHGLCVRYTSESLSVIRLIAKLSSEFYTVQSEIIVQEGNFGSVARNATLTLYGEDAENILKLSGVLNSDKTIFSQLTDDREAMRTYIRGVFLACGSITNPNKSYHLELVCRSKDFVERIIEYCAMFDVNVKATSRKDSHIAYIKDSTEISDFLKIIGASESTCELENVKLYRDVRNYANRTRNCDVANIQKSAAASAIQIEAMQLVLDNVENLPEHLALTARTRIMYPDATLSELADILGLGRSGLHHRLRKIIDIAKEIQEEKGG